MSAHRVAAAVVLALGLAACADQPSAPASEPRPEPRALQQQEEVVPGEILVRMKDGISLNVLTGATPGLRLERPLAEPSRVSVLSVTRGRERTRCNPVFRGAFFAAGEGWWFPSNGACRQPLPRSLGEGSTAVARNERKAGRG